MYITSWSKDGLPFVRTSCLPHWLWHKVNASCMFSDLSWPCVTRTICEMAACPGVSMKCFVFLYVLCICVLVS